MPTPKPPYSAAEVAALRQWFPTGTRAEIEAALPSRRWATIARKASSLGIHRPHRIPTAWDAAQDAILRTHYPTGGAPAVASLLNRTPVACHKRAHKLGIVRDFGPGSGVANPFTTAYTVEEQALVRKLYPRTPWEELFAALPGRTRASVEREARRQEVSRHFREWLPEHLELLRAHYRTHGSAWVARHTGRTRRQVVGMACRLNLRTDVRRKEPRAKPARPPKPPKPVVAKAPKLAPTPKAQPLPGIQANVKTPVLNAAKTARLAKEKQQPSGDWLADMRKLPGDYPARLAYTKAARISGAAGKAAYFTALQQAA